jgi:hypothetical protein
MTVVFDSREIDRFVNDIEKKAAPLLAGVINKTTAISLRLVKTTLPKRTGNLRGSYQQKKVDKFARLISSPLKYAENIELGSKARTIKAKHAKVLTIPIKESVLTSTRAQIKQSSLNTLFRRLKKRKGKTSKEIQDEVGIILTKTARRKAIQGKLFFERIIQPKTQNVLNQEVIKAAQKLGFT